MRTKIVALVALLITASAPLAVVAQDDVDALPSWNKGPARTAILDFVACAINPDCGSYIPPAERIAVFDNDGTLWSEQPMYFQLAFAVDRVALLADKHPEWQKQEPFASILKHDVKGLAASGENGLAQVVAATHAGMTTDEFQQIAKEWFAMAKHPKFKRPYNQLTYQPMVELLEHLRENGFKAYIVSGGGVEFIRVIAEEAYGIPPEQVIGSTIRTKYELRDGKPAVVRLPEIDFIDDKAGKPVAINKYIGRRPVFAFGNSDGDFEMLEWTTTGNGPRLGLIVHHTDAEREYAYDRESHVGKLDRSLTEAKDRGWILVDMKKDWNQVFPVNKP